MRLVFPFVCLAVLAAASGGAAGSLSVSTRDGAGQPLPCRVVARNGSGSPIHPDSTQLCYPHIGTIPYFVSDGDFTLAADGPVTLTFSRGPEYRSETRSVQVTGSASLTVTLNRFIDMPAAGWHSGDTHAHLWHGEPNPLEPQDGVAIARAEGLNFISILDADRYFTGSADPASTPDCLLYASMEYRSHVFGHIAMPGLRALITPYSSAAPGDPAYPLNADMIDLAKVQSGLVLYAHPVPHSDPAEFWGASEWPATGIARELPADAALGIVDGIEVFSYSNHSPLAALPLWYDLLNAGRDVAATAGTDCVINRPGSSPVGGYRVYVHTGQPAFDMSAWLDALRLGRSFVTAGPLVTGLSVGGAGIGDTLLLPLCATQIQGTVSFASDMPLLYYEVIWNGSVAHLGTLPFATAATADFSIPVDESGWLAVRVTSMARADVQVMSLPLAHTSPLWVEAGGRPIVPDAATARRLAQSNDDLVTLVRLRGGFEEAADSLRVESVLANGTAAILSPFDSPPLPPQIEKPSLGETVGRQRPVLQWLPPEDPDPGEVFDYRVRLAVSPEALASATPSEASGTSFMPAAPLEHGQVYWWNVEARDTGRNSVTSQAVWFVVDTTGTASVPISGPVPARWSAHPLPFAGSVEIRNSAAGSARIEIFDVRGRRVRALEGWTPLVWNGLDETGRQAPSGLYFAVPRRGPVLRLVKLR